MQSGQVSEDKLCENQNADLERILKNITESSRYHEYAEKYDFNAMPYSKFSVEDNLSDILLESILAQDVDFIRYILESFENHCKLILNRHLKHLDFPVFCVISDLEQYAELTEDVEHCIQNEKDILSLLFRFGVEINSRAARMRIASGATGNNFVHGSLAFNAMMQGNLELLKFILDKCEHMNKEERKYMVNAIFEEREWSIVALMYDMRTVQDRVTRVRNKYALEMAVRLYAFSPESFCINNNSRRFDIGFDEEANTDLYFYMNFLMTDSMLLMAERSCDNVREKLKLRFMRSVREAMNKFNGVTGFNDVAIDPEKLTRFLNGINDEKWKFSMDPALAISHMPQKYAAQFLENILATQDAEIILKAASQFKKHQSYNEIIDECADSIWNFLASQNDEKLNEYTRTVNKIIEQFYVSRWQVINIESVDGSNARLDELGSLIAKIIFMASARHEELESGYTSELKTLLMSYLRMGGDPENVVCGEWESNNQLRAINKNFNSHAPEVWVESLSRIPDEYYLLMFCRGQLDSLIYYVDQIKLVAVTNRNICNKIESFGSLLHDQSRCPDDVLQGASESWGALREDLESYVMSSKNAQVSFFKGTEDNIALVLKSINTIFAHHQVKKRVNSDRIRA